MIAHFGTLFIAALSNTISLVLYSIHYFNDSYDKNSDLYLRLFITYNYAKVAVYTSWFIVHILMLKIFITYGRALQGDQEDLFKENLTLAFETDEKRGFQKRLKAYQEMADEQVRQIMLHLRSYSQHTDRPFLDDYTTED